MGERKVEKLEVVTSTCAREEFPIQKKVQAMIGAECGWKQGEVQS